MPLYGKHDALQSLQLLKPEREVISFSPLPGWKATFSHAGHILGAAGASGGTGDEDELICAAGVKAAGLVVG